MKQAGQKNVFFISLSQFGTAFANNYIKVFMPFLILSTSSYSPEKTLIWIGIIMGSTHLVTAVASNFWGFLASRFSPKLMYLRGMIGHLVLCACMGLSTDLTTLLLLRILQGFFGGISTIGLIIVSSSSSREKISANVGFFQTFITLGQLIGPLLGSVAASAFGYRGAFMSASAFLLIVLFLCIFNVEDVPRPVTKERFLGRSTLNRKTIWAWVLSFMVTMQLMFLPSIFPNVLAPLHMERSGALRWAGIITMAYTATATFGTLLWTRLSRRFGTGRMIFWLVLLGTLFQALLSIRGGIVQFTVFRMIQAGLIAAVIPLAISIYAAEMKGGAVGFLNSARFAGTGLGPMMATSILAFSNLTTLYLLISALTLVALLGFRAAFGGLTEIQPSSRNLPATD
jgi:MFS transporter, DHA1 family, multidrug resistance protein